MTLTLTRESGGNFADWAPRPEAMTPAAPTTAMRIEAPEWRTGTRYHAALGSECKKTVRWQGERRRRPIGRRSAATVRRGLDVGGRTSDFRLQFRRDMK